MWTDNPHVAHIAGVYYLPLPASAHQADCGDLSLALKVIRVIAGDKSGCSMLADHRRGVTSHQPDTVTHKKCRVLAGSREESQVFETLNFFEKA